MTTTHREHATARRRPAGRSRVDLEIVVPALNEEYRLPLTLQAVLDVCADLRRERRITSRIVVVDNGSVDRTAEVADRFSAEHPDLVTVLGCSVRGKGAAVRRGVMTSRSDNVGFLDADLAVPAEALHQVVERFHEGADVVIGSRRCEGAEYAVRQNLVRRTGSQVFRRAIRPLVPSVTDTQCGFKFFTGTAAHLIFSGMHTDGFSFDVELLARAHALGLPIVEIPVTWTDGAMSTLRPFAHGGEIVRELRRLRRMSRDAHTFVA